MISDFKVTEKQVICGICPAGCWVTATYNNEGKLHKVRPDKSSSLGMICTLGEHSPEIVYSKHRLKHPLRRKGEKGNYDFERISWDDAYEIIVENLERIKTESGPEATAIYTGRGSFEQSLCDIFQPKGVAVSSASSVLFPFGSPNTLGVRSSLLRLLRDDSALRATGVDGRQAKPPNSHKKSALGTNRDKIDIRKWSKFAHPIH